MKLSLWQRVLSGSKVIGIEVTDQHLKLCEAEKTGKGIRVSKYIIEELPEGMIKDGVVIQMEELQTKLLETLKQHKIRTKNIHFALPSQTVMVRVLKLPDAPDKDLRKLIQNDMKNNFHGVFEDAYYDFVRLHKIHTTPNNMEKQAALTGGEDQQALIDVMVAAAPKDALYKYMDMFKFAGLRPLSFEIKGFSLLRLIEHSQLQLQGATLLVDVNATSSDLTIIDEGQLRITRNVDIEWSREEEMLFSQMESIYGVERQADTSYAVTSGARDLLQAMDRLINFYSFSIYESQRPVGHIIISGDVPEMELIVQYIQENVSQQVTLTKKDKLFGDQRIARGMELEKYAIPLGLALRGNKA